jgi:hypothetical protein
MIGFIGASIQPLLITITTAHNRWLSKTRSIPSSNTTVFCSTVDWLALMTSCLTNAFLLKTQSTTAFNDDFSSTTDWDQSQCSVMTDGQSASLSWNKAPFGDLRPDFYYCQRQLRVSWRGALSLTRGRVYHSQLLLVLASAVIFESESRGCTIGSFSGRAQLRT